MAVGPTDGGSTEAQRSTPASRRYPLALLAGVLGGALLGMWAGHEASRPGWGSLGAVVPIAVAVIIVLGLLVAAGVKRSGLPVAAALALVAATWFAAQVAPGAPGSDATASGTGSVGTVGDPDAIWSGPVTCEWTQDVSSAIEVVRGFHAPGLLVREPASGECRIDAISLRPEYEGPTAFCSDGGPLFLKDSASLAVNMSRDRRSGTASLVGGGYLEPIAPDVYAFTWACDGGP